MKFFMDCSTLEELKQLYRKLCIKNHPDLGGDEETMKEINAEYKEALQKLSFAYNADETHKDTHDWRTDMFADVLQKIIHFSNMSIEIIGQWIWCFNSFEYKDQLKQLGFWFSSSKKAWVYSGDKKKCIRSHNKVDDLRKKWGSTMVQTERQEKLN